MRPQAELEKGLLAKRAKRFTLVNNNSKIKEYLFQEIVLMRFTFFDAVFMDTNLKSLYIRMV